MTERVRAVRETKLRVQRDVTSSLSHLERLTSSLG